MKFPIFPTSIVAAAMALMIGLGVWQWNKAQHETPHGPFAGDPITFPAHYAGGDLTPYLWHKANGYCALVTGWDASAGRNLKGDSGWKHLATCFQGDAGSDPMAVNIGWSTDATNPDWQGGQVSGMIIEGPDRTLHLVADTAAPGLQPSEVPAPNTVNHLSYALQWWAFALIAAVIYVLVLRRRAK
ncbi:MAG: SURF1 family protein [Alphaproteobacteria bacterium]|nr:SURF1 family protein [Alphaproteobacteria bacterium]MDE2340103.1 SURF1 family protein [Alphaproteobacteria bacterium]